MTASPQLLLTPARGFLISVGVVAGVALSLVSLVKGEPVIVALAAVFTVRGIHLLVADARLMQVSAGSCQLPKDVGAAGL